MNKIDLYSDEFKIELINQAYDYLSENSSLRKVASKYKISHVTLRDHFIKYLPKLDSYLSNLVNEKIEERKEKSIDDPFVRERVAKSYTLIIVNNMTIEEIAKKLNTTPFTIYRDLTSRLSKIKEFGEEHYEIVKSKLLEHSLNSLQSGLKPDVNMLRENGKFIGRAK